MLPSNFIPYDPLVLHSRQVLVTVYLLAAHWSYWISILPSRAWSTTTRMVSGSRSRIRISLLIIFIIVRRLAAVSYNERVRQGIIHFSCYCRNSSEQVLPAPLSSSSVVVIVDGSMYGKLPSLSLLLSIVLDVVVTAL